MIRRYGEGGDILELLAERESLYQRLTQTKFESLSKKFTAYTIDPRTRYLNLNLVRKYNTVCKKVKYSNVFTTRMLCVSLTGS